MYQMDFNKTIYDLNEVKIVCSTMRLNGGKNFIQDRSWLFTTYPSCFVANEAVKWLMIQLQWSLEQATFFGRLLRTRNLIHHVTNTDQKFEDDNEWWRFQADEEGPLNWKQIWTVPVQEPPAEIMHALLKNLLIIIQKHLSRFDTPLPPSALIRELGTLSRTKAFNDWEEALAVLQKVALVLSQTERLSFWVNCYNTLALHALIKSAQQQIDPLDSIFYRKSFFTTHKYLISDLLFSLDDIEHGILRPLNQYFEETDSRSLHKLVKPDSRIFSVLSCCTLSSPSIIVINPKIVEKTLNFATQQYFQRSVRIQKGVIVLPKLCYWYKADYNITTTNVLDFVTPVLTLQQSNQLHEATNRKGELQIEYMDYSWDLFVDHRTFCLD